MRQRNGLALGSLLLAAAAAIFTLLLLVNVRGGPAKRGAARLLELHAAGLRFKERLQLDSNSAVRLPGRSPVVLDGSGRRLTVFCWNASGHDDSPRIPLTAVSYQAVETPAGVGNSYLLRNGQPVCPYPLSSLRFASSIRGCERVLTVTAMVLEHDVAVSTGVAGIPLSFDVRFRRIPAERGYREFVTFPE